MCVGYKVGTLPRNSLERMHADRPRKLVIWLCAESPWLGMDGGETSRKAHDVSSGATGSMVKGQVTVQVSGAETVGTRGEASGKGRGAMDGAQAGREEESGTGGAVSVWCCQVVEGTGAPEDAWASLTECRRGCLGQVK